MGKSLHYDCLCGEGHYIMNFYVGSHHIMIHSVGRASHIDFLCREGLTYRFLLELELGFGIWKK